MIVPIALECGIHLRHIRERTRSILGGIPTQSAHRYTQVLLEEYDDDRSYALRGNASQDAPRPLLNVAQMRA